MCAPRGLNRLRQKGAACRLPEGTFRGWLAQVVLLYSVTPISGAPGT